MSLNAGISGTDPEDELDTEGHALAGNVNETVVIDETPTDDTLDTEGHALASNVNETVVSDETPNDDDALDVEDQRNA